MSVRNCCHCCFSSSFFSRRASTTDEDPRVTTESAITMNMGTRSVAYASEDWVAIANVAAPRPDNATLIVDQTAGSAMVLGASGFFALGAAMPERFPLRGHFAATTAIIPFRFVIPFLSLLIARALGVDVPGGAWVVALAPSGFLPIAMARLYGFDRRVAAALPMLTIPIAALLLPVVALLGRA